MVLVLIGFFGTAVVNAAASDDKNYSFELMKRFAATYLDGAEYVNPNYSENGSSCHDFYSGEDVSSGVSLDRKGHRDFRRSEFCT